MSLILSAVFSLLLFDYHYLPSFRFITGTCNSFMVAVISHASNTITRILYHFPVQPAHICQCLIKRFFTLLHRMRKTVTGTQTPKKLLGSLVSTADWWSSKQADLGHPPSLLPISGKISFSHLQLLFLKYLKPGIHHFYCADLQKCFIQTLPSPMFFSSEGPIKYTSFKCIQI